MSEPGTAVVVMAKAPVPGAVKTRLIPALGAAGAARLAARMLRHALAQARAAALGPVWLCGAPAADHPAFDAAVAAAWPAGTVPGLRRSAQGGGDLGARMARAVAACEAAGLARVLIIGTDCPTLDAAVLRSADAALPGRDVVLVPALDGGYVLVGLAAARPGLSRALFEDLPWSTPGLLQATRTRLADAGWQHAELPALADIDEPADLGHLPAGWLA